MIIKNVAELPALSSGMLVQYKDDSWLQLLSEYSKGTWLVNTLCMGSSGQPEVTWVMEAVDFDGRKNIKSMHWSSLGDTKALTCAQIASILNGDKSVGFGGYSWFNPEYLPAKKMTVAEIEQELGYRVEVVAEGE